MELDLLMTSHSYTIKNILSYALQLVLSNCPVLLPGTTVYSPIPCIQHPRN